MPGPRCTRARAQRPVVFCATARRWPGAIYKIISRAAPCFAERLAGRAKTFDLMTKESTDKVGAGPRVFFRCFIVCPLLSHRTALYTMIRRINNLPKVMKLVGCSWIVSFLDSKFSYRRVQTKSRNCANHFVSMAPPVSGSTARARVPVLGHSHYCNAPSIVTSCVSIGALIPAAAPLLLGVRAGGRGTARHVGARARLAATSTPRLSLAPLSSYRVRGCTAG
jgi:hypothetical protein